LIVWKYNGAMDFEPIPNLYLGTSSWSAESWVGPFYPPGTSPVEFLSVYAGHYNTVEIDSTYYRIPSRKLVRGWYDRTPDGFIFSAKFPGDITHKKVLINCEGETEEFLGVMELLGEKLGPLLLQFPYLNQEVIPSSEEFLARSLVAGPITFNHPGISMQLIGTRIADLPIDASLIETSALGLRFSPEELVDSGLVETVVAAQKKGTELIESPGGPRTSQHQRRCTPRTCGHQG